MKFHQIVWLLPLFLFACAAPQKGGTGKKMHTTKKSMEKKGGEMAKDAASGPGSVTCKAGKDERSITRAVNENGGCEVVYTKNGESKTVANAANDLGYCDKIVDKIRTNLSNAGFTCE